MSEVSRDKGVRLDPFVFVAATRYAILTSASELVADQVLAHAEEIKRDPGAAEAIRREVEDFDAHFHALDFGQNVEELEAVKRRWRRVAEALL